MISLTTHNGTTTIVRVGAQAGSTTAHLGISGEGVARCKVDDFYTDRTGELIALGRAIQDFGKQVEQAGLERTVTNDEVLRVLAELLESLA